MNTELNKKKSLFYLVLWILAVIIISDYADKDARATFLNTCEQPFSGEVIQIKGTDCGIVSFKFRNKQKWYSP